MQAETTMDFCDPVSAFREFQHFLLRPWRRFHGEHHMEWTVSLLCLLDPPAGIAGRVKTAADKSDTCKARTRLAADQLLLFDPLLVEQRSGLWASKAFSQSAAIMW